LLPEILGIILQNFLGPPHPDRGGLLARTGGGYGQAIDTRLVLVQIFLEVQGDVKFDLDQIARFDIVVIVS